MNVHARSDIKVPCPLSVYVVSDSIAASVSGILHTGSGISGALTTLCFESGKPLHPCNE